jgi:hypothetical protein
MTIDNPLGICFLVPFGTLLGTCSQNVAMLLITEEDVPEFGGLYSAVFVSAIYLGFTKCTALQSGRAELRQLPPLRCSGKCL